MVLALNTSSRTAFTSVPIFPVEFRDLCKERGAFYTSVLIVVRMGVASVET
jgi:hypothetical protein